MLKALLSSFLTLFSWTNTDVALSILPITDAAGNSYCTAFSINEERKLFMSALHCMTAITWIGGKPVTVIDYWPSLDVVIVEAEKGIFPLFLANREPLVAEEVSTLGYGGGSPTLIPVNGRILSLNFIAPFETPFPQHVYGLHSIRFLCGHSGGPILNKYGDVVGILQWGFWINDIPCVGNQAGGTSWSDLRKATLQYWESP